MKFIPNSTIKEEMLKDIGLNDIDELFSDIPKEISLKKLNLSKSLSQRDATKKLRNISKKNKSLKDLKFFMGGGIKPHFIPSIVKSIISRDEFYTAYTPYQSEASQGFLQAMFEYQSFIAELTGLDVANCSLYDGVTALGESALMCMRVNKRNTFLIPKNISWEKKSVLNNYAKGPNLKIKEIPYDAETGKIDIEKLKDHIDSNISGIYLENPNFFGIFEDDINEIKKILEELGILFVVGIDPVSLGIIKSPGDYGADIVIGEGRSLGNSMNFGGICACKKEFLRQIPGRIIGLTKDKENNRAFCMALQTREQHIRRGKATSNICTNEGLCALAATTYLSWLGKEGLEELSRINFENGQLLSEKICSLNGFEMEFNGVHFNEFVIRTNKDPKKINNELLNNNIQGGLLIDKWFSDLKNCILFGISEIYDTKDIEKFIIDLGRAYNV